MEFRLTGIITKHLNPGCLETNCFETNLSYWHVRRVSEFLHSSLALMPPATFLAEDFLSHRGVLWREPKLLAEMNRGGAVSAQVPMFKFPGHCYVILSGKSFIQLSGHSEPIGSALRRSLTEYKRPLSLSLTKVKDRVKLQTWSKSSLEKWIWTMLPVCTATVWSWVKTGPLVWSNPAWHIQSMNFSTCGMHESLETPASPHCHSPTKL